MVFTIVLFTCYGYIPDVYTIQVLYYSFAIFALVLGIVYATSAVVVFFRDLSQIISIALQVGIWMTPIMWKLTDKPALEKIQWIFKLNPLYYVVTGYRDSLYEKVWFFEHPVYTLYFWVFVIAMYVFGTGIFNRLKVHLADVL